MGRAGRGGGVKKRRRVKLPTLKRLQARADRLWSKMILADGADTEGVTLCRVCREKRAVSAHHIFHKGAHGRARYDRRNGLPICTGCHLRERFDPTPVVVAAIDYRFKPFFDLAEDVTKHPGPHVWNRERLNMVIIAMEAILEVPDAAGPTAR
jgi:hypothetical protein